MGMFDTIQTRCPECGKVVDLQSKGAAEPNMNTYLGAMVPPAVALGVRGDVTECGSCHAVLTVVVEIPASVRVSLVLTPGTGSGSELECARCGETVDAEGHFCEEEPD